ncbi:MAG TPA: PKD domain-containing protein [Candidatus Binatia bacterium]
MKIRSRFVTIALLPTLLSLAACSREEPAATQAPTTAQAPAPQAAAPAAPAAAPAAPAAPAAAPAEKAEAPAADLANDPRVLENPTPEEPGFLTAFADADETIGDAPFTVKLNVDVVENTGTPPYTYIWDFGDATEFSTEKSPTHTYTIPGSFRASVIVRDSKGEVDQDYIDVSVSDPNMPSGITAEQLMQQVPVEEILRQAREAAAKGAGQQGATGEGGAQ